jgi:5-methylcytosine-specific restriction endonuclease McrA
MSAGVVVLNADYSFLNIIDWKKAICLLEKGKVEVIKYSDKFINSVNGCIKLPVVLRLIKFIRILFKSKVPFSKKNVMARDGFTCAYCGRTDAKLTVDHIKPKSSGGKSTFENCVSACRECNLKKGNKTCSEAKMFPKLKAYAPTINEFLLMRVSSLGIKDFMQDIFDNL